MPSNPTDSVVAVEGWPGRWRWYLGLAAALAALLVWAGLHNAGLLNTDAVAYLRLAGYYAEGRWDLAVSGYWGPLLSWLMVPFFKLGVSPLGAARSVMVLSALVFLAGSGAFLCRLGLPRIWTRVGLGLVAVASVGWSVENISPDLLQGGLVLFALASLLDSEAAPGGFWKTGLWFGVAYLAKAIALPLALALITITCVASGWRRRDAGFALGRWGAALAVFFLVAGPWIAILSVKYGRPTFSTTARIAHALVGPGNSDHHHPIGRTFHTPAPGRVTTWEDPSGMDYPYWSPFESAAAFDHQLAVVRMNAGIVGGVWRSLDGWCLGLLAGIAGLTFWGGRGRLAEAPRWLAAGIPLVVLGAAYLPVAISPLDQRYFYVAWPLLFALAAGGANELGRRAAVTSRVVTLIAAGGLLASFGVPALAGLPPTLTGWDDPASRVAHDLAGRLRRHGVTGRVAGSGMIGPGRTGLYVAYLLGQPWHGDEPAAAADRWRESGADLMIVNRGRLLTASLDTDSGFQSLDGLLFASAAEADSFPLKVYRVRRSAPGH